MFFLANKRFLDQKMDVRDMTFEKEQFDCVIDKGTLDSVLVKYFFNFLNKLLVW